MRYFILATLISLLTACASTEKYVLEKGIDVNSLATLHLYRTDVFVDSFNPEKPFIYLNEKLIAKLGTGQSTTIKVPAGKHRLSVKQPLMFMPSYESDAFNYEFKAGETYYVRYNYGVSDVAVIAGSVAVTGTSDFHLTTKENYLDRK